MARRHPKNVEAILAWFRKNRPESVHQIEQILRLDAQNESRASALLALLLQGFEAGREFQARHPDTPLGGGAHYLPGKSP